MVERKVVLKSENGIHARPALAIVKEASKFKSDVYILKDGDENNAKSIVGVMAVDAVKGDELIVKAIGEDEISAAEALAYFIENKLE